MTTLAVFVESEPHSQNLDDVILNRPAPSGGAFILNGRVPNDVWRKLKSAGAWYMSADDLEDLDMFFSEPGWRYGIAALRVLIESGYELEMREQLVKTMEQLDEMFTEEAKATYRQQQAEARAAATAVAAKTAEAEARERKAAKAEYSAWKAELTDGLVKLFVHSVPEARNAKWEQFHYADGPGTWYTTGDSWSRAEIDGQTCFQCSYGNAVVYYAPSEIANRWVEQYWLWLVAVYNNNASLAAQSILTDSLQNYIGSEIAIRLVDLRGTHYFTQLAEADGEGWWLYTSPNSSSDWEREAAHHYGVKLVELVEIPMTYNELFVTARNHFPNGIQIKSYWQHPDGRVIGRGNNESEFAVFQVSDLPEAIRHKFVVVT